MTRKEWLEKFIELCESGAKTLDFRRHCRVKAQHLPRHTRRLAEYRAELAALQAVEDEAKRQEEIRQARLRALEEARRVRAEQAAIRARGMESRLQESAGESTDADGVDSGGDEEAVGPREDNSED